MKTPFEIIELRRQLNNTAEVSMKEKETKKALIGFIKDKTESLEIVDRGEWFYVFKQGKVHDNAIAFRADFDAVLCEDGCARHLCGHDGHSAALCGFALWLDENEVNRDVYLIFQPGEETGQGAVICAPFLDEKKIKEIYGFHNIPGREANTVMLLDKTFACASTGLEIKLTGEESHAAYPENGNNPALVVSEIILHMDETVKQKHNGVVLGTVIGIDLGSKSYGVSAGCGTLRLTLRAEYQNEFDEFVNKIENLAKKLAGENGLGCEIRRIEEFPATVNAAKCSVKVRDAAESMGIRVITPKEPFRWSEDFGHYLKKIDGAFFGVGIGEDHTGLHTADYEFNDEIIGTVIEIYKYLALRV